MTLNQELSQNLHSTSLFSGFSDHEFLRIREICNMVLLTSGDSLFVEGEACAAIYFLEKGLIKLFIEDSQRQKERIIEFIHPGETFAEAALFSGQGYPVNAQAADESWVIRINAYHLTQLLRDQPQLSWKMMAQLSRRLHQLIGSIRSLSLHNAEQKVAYYLLNNTELELPTCCVTRVPTDRAGLASYLGLTTETTCRIISQFRKSGWINVDNRRIVVLQRERLERLFRAG